MKTEVLCIWVFASSYTNMVAINIWSLGKNDHSDIKINMSLTVHSNIKINNHPGWNDVTDQNPQEFIIRWNRNTCNTWHLHWPFQITQALHNNQNIMFLLTCSWPFETGSRREMMSVAVSELWVTCSKRSSSTRPYVFDPVGHESVFKVACVWVNICRWLQSWMSEAFISHSRWYKRHNWTLVSISEPFKGVMHQKAKSYSCSTVLVPCKSNSLLLNLYTVISFVELKRKIMHIYEKQPKMKPFQLRKEQVKQQKSTIKVVHMTYALQSHWELQQQWKLSANNYFLFVSMLFS